MALAHRELSQSRQHGPKSLPVPCLDAQGCACFSQPLGFVIVSAVSAQAEHPLLGGGGSPPTEHSWESIAFPSHVQALGCATGVCRCIFQELVLTHVAAGQKSECDQVSGGNWEVSHHLFLSFRQAFLFLFHFSGFVTFALHTPEWQ